MKLSNKLTKSHLSHQISKETGFSKNLSKKLIEDLIEISIKGIIKGSLNLKNFGHFKVLHKSERIGRNPKTKEIFKINERKSISFRASQKFMKNLNM